VRPRVPIALIFLAILVASCGARPGVTVSIAGQAVPMALASTTEGTACSTSIGDAFPQNLPLTSVRGPTAPILRFEAGEGATEIRGAIYDLAGPAGGPIEEFTLPGRSAEYQPRSIVLARTYRVLVNVVWSFVLTHGEATHLFEMRVEPG
jgi:hypothetical protein